MKFLKLQKLKGMSRKKKKLLLVGTALLCLLLAAGYTVFIQPLLQREKWIYKETAVQRGNLTVGVTESGTLDYGITSQLYDLDLSVGEEDSEEEDSEEEETTEKYLKVEEIYAAPGQKIAEGDVLMKFTEDSLEDVKRLLLSAQTQAQVAYAEAESEYNLSVLQAKLQKEADTAGENYANAIYKYANQAVSDSIGANKLELERLTSKRESYRESYEEAEESLQEAKEAFEEAKTALESAGDNEHVYIPLQSAYLSAKTRYQQAQTKTEQAKQAITDNEKQIVSLESQISLTSAQKTISQLEVKNTYQSSALTGEIAQTAYEAKLEGLKEELQEAKEKLQAVNEQVEGLEAFVGEDGIVYAKGTGIVTEIGYESGDYLVMSGVVAAYAAAGDMTITVDVSEEDIINMKVGDSVDIVFNAYDGLSWKGIVTAIQTTSTSEDSATVSYPVTIAVQGDTDSLYGGMTADVTFATESKEDVLYLSKKAIIEQNGKKYVYVDNVLGKKVLQEVETGLSNGINVEIINGLQEGDTVYIASKVSSEAMVNDTGTDTPGAPAAGENIEIITGSGSSTEYRMQNGGMRPSETGGMGGQGVQITPKSGMGGMAQ